MITQFALLFTLLSATTAQADSLFSRSQGEVNFTVAENPVSHFKHYVGTYIPKSVSMNELSQVPVVIFLHGGSALDQSPSNVPDLKIENGEFTHCVVEREAKCSKNYGKSQIEMYMSTNEGVTGIKEVAERNQFIAILPGSNIGWNNNSVPLFRDLKQKAISELNLNPKLFVLAGHSMGAMGTIRTSGNLIGEFKAFLAFSGTLNRAEMNEPYVRSLLGTPLYIINEEEALYQSFLTDSAVLKEYSDALAVKYEVPSQLKIVVAHGNHNTVLNEMGDVLHSALKNATFTALDRSYFEQDKFKKRNVYRPLTSHWIGNATCGKYVGIEKNFNVFKPSKYVYVKIQTGMEGLINDQTQEIAKTYEPRLANIESMTFSGGSNFEFLKTLPKYLKNITEKDGEYLCSLLVFDQDSQVFQSSDGFLFAAGQSEVEAEANLLKQYQERIKP